MTRRSTAWGPRSSATATHVLGFVLCLSSGCDEELEARALGATEEPAPYEELGPVEALGLMEESGPIDELGPASQPCSKWELRGCDDRHSFAEPKVPSKISEESQYTLAMLPWSNDSRGPLQCEGGLCRISPGKSVHSSNDCRRGQGKVPFGDLPTFASCSGLLVESKGQFYAITADHCYPKLREPLSSSVVKNNPFVASVHSNAADDDPLENIPTARVFFAREIIARSHTRCTEGVSKFGPDWLVVWLSPADPLAPTPGIRVDSLVPPRYHDRSCDQPPTNQSPPEICAVAHSLGTAATWSCSGLYKRRPDGYWVTGLDFYNLGSGGPVWTETGEFVGLGACSTAGVENGRCEPCCGKFGPGDVASAMALLAYPIRVCGRDRAGTWVSPLIATQKSGADALTFIRRHSEEQRKAKCRELVQARSQRETRAKCKELERVDCGKLKTLKCKAPTQRPINRRGPP